MPKVVAFPGVEPGRKVALYTQNHIYSGTVDRREPFPEGTGLWLNNVSVLPIKSQVSQPEILRLDYVCVLWNQVVAIGFPPKLSPAEQTE